MISELNTKYVFVNHVLITFYRGESNFHVFYYLYDGLESEGRWRKFYLDEQLKSRHRYLQPLSVVHREHNVHRWRQLNQAFKV